MNNNNNFELIKVSLNFKLPKIRILLKSNTLNKSTNSIITKFILSHTDICKTNKMLKGQSIRNLSSSVINPDVVL